MTFGLNFRRNIFGDGEVTRINVEQVLELKRQRLLEKENDNSNETLINNLCDIKLNNYKTKCNLMKSGNINNLCTCWYIFNEFVDVDIQESMEADGNNEINIFNKNTMERFQLFMNGTIETNKVIDSIRWETFLASDSVNRFICELSEAESATDCIDEGAMQQATSDKWGVLRQYFDELATSCNSYLMGLVATLCRRSVSSLLMSASDVALLHRLHNDATTSRRCINGTASPLVFVVKYRCAIDYLLLPLLFQQAGIAPPVYFTGESRQVRTMQSILSRIGYVIVKDADALKYPRLQSFLLEKKAAMVLESGRSICLVIGAGTNSYSSANGQQTEIRVLHSAVGAFIDGKLPEPLIVPISISHECIPKEFLSRSNSAWSSNGCALLLLRMLSGGAFGVVKMSICKPIYYSQFACNVDLDQSSSSVDTEHQLQKLVKHLSMFTDRCQLVMPTNLVAFLMLYHFKDRKSVSVQQMANVGHDLIKYVLSSESLGFEFTSVITTIRRGCNMLSHCISVATGASGDCLLTVDWESYSVIGQLDLLADVIVHKILMKSVVACAFVTESRLSHTTRYTSQLTVPYDTMNNSISNVVKILLSRFFQFLLPCECLDDEVTKLNTWWNETMVSVTRETDTLHTDSELQPEVLNWRADVYDSRVRDQILMLARSVAPRLEALQFIVVELMQHKQVECDSMTLCCELHAKVDESIKTAGKSGQLRFKSCLSSDHFVSGIVTLAAHEMIRIFDIPTREWVLRPASVDLLLSRYAVLDCEYYNLQRWKTFIDMALLAAA